MNRLITSCPSCHEGLIITSLKCPACGLELRNDFDLSVFDRLGDEQYAFLITFLKNRGNLKKVQNDLQISYTIAKKKLDGLLGALGIAETHNAAAPEEVDLSQMNTHPESSRASEIIKAKLINEGGRAAVPSVSGRRRYELSCYEDGTFNCEGLPNHLPFNYAVFDIIVDLLLSNGGRARKGNGRSYKVGDPECDDTTIVGTIAKKYFGKRDGDSAYDPVFVLSAILVWAGIVSNAPGELVLTESYQRLL